MIVLGLCPRCGEARIRSTREYEPRERLDPADFEGVGDHPAPPTDQPGAPIACADCGTPLVFRRDPASAPPQPTQPDSAAPPLTATNGHTPHPPAIQTLFAAAEAEDVVAMRELPNHRFLIQTTRRLVLVDLTLYLQEGPHA